MKRIFQFHFQILPLFVVLIGISLSSFSQDSLQVVVAEKGDGILSLLRKQGVNPYDHYDDFIAMNMDNLRDSVHLYAGRKYRIPTMKLDTVAIVDSIQKKTTEIKKIEGKDFAIFAKTMLPCLLKVSN